MSSGLAVLRLLRAVVFTTVCVAVSAGGHLLVGGGRIPPQIMALAAAAAFALAYALNGRERGPETVLAVTLGAQLLLHELFSRGAPAPHAEVSGGHTHPGVGMVTIHVAVALLTGWWLHRGESALWLMIRLYGAAPPRIAQMVIAVPVEPPQRIRQVVAVPAPRLRGGWDLASAVRRRGPPMRPHAA